jgi:hypothetical protein
MFFISLLALTFLELIWKQEVSQAILLHLEILQTDKADEIHNTFL